MIKHVFIDLDDTILDFKKAESKALSNTLINFNIEPNEAIIKLYNERKEKPENKDLINYFVGMFCVKGYRTTYNWIVQHMHERDGSIVCAGQY